MSRCNAYRYTALICSLPVCDTLFEAKRPPISRYQLHQRFSELDEQDAQDLQRLAEVLDWFQQPHERTDEQLMDLFEHHLSKIESPEIAEMLRWRMSFRTVIGALRLRNAGGKLPANHWGYGRWLAIAKRHWQEPTLGLEGILPWVPEAVGYLREEKAMALEKLILKLVWDWLARLAWHHQFDLAAVAIYRMRWDLVSRWICYAPEPAAERFNSMVEDFLNETIDWSQSSNLKIN